MPGTSAADARLQARTMDSPAAALHATQQARRFLLVSIGLFRMYGEPMVAALFHVQLIACSRQGYSAC